MDATIIESHKKQALPHYKGGRGYQPSLVYWVEQDVVVADEFRDGNVPAGKGPLEVVKRAFAALPASVEHRRFRADSAAYEESTLQWLADPTNRIERFTISADMTPPLRKLAEGVASVEWKVYEMTYNLLSAMKVLALPQPVEDARPKRLRFAVFHLPARLVSHARKLLARVAKCLLERADLLLGRARLRATYAT